MERQGPKEKKTEDKKKKNGRRGGSHASRNGEASRSGAVIEGGSGTE